MNKQLNEMNAKELGKLFPIILTDYDPNWPKIYLSEESEIREAVRPENIHRMEHIGSTAVPGLKAKPTIDILLEVKEWIDLDWLIAAMSGISYHLTPKPENPPPGMTFVKGYTPSGFQGQAFHVHVRFPGNWDEVHFRDYLINHPETAREYAELKMGLSVQFRNNREAYTNSKTEFVERVNKISGNPI